MMKDLEIAFTAKEITAFGGVSLLYKMLDNCHLQESGVAQVVTITLTSCVSTLRSAT